MQDDEFNSPYSYPDSSRDFQPESSADGTAVGHHIPFLVPDAEGAFTPALPSVASRKISLRSPASKRGALVTHFGQRRAVVFESHLELMTALIILRLPGLVDLIDQPPPVEYVDLDGAVHSHTFDYMPVFSDRTKWAVAVKPHHQAESKGLATTLELIATQNANFANQFHLVTEKCFSASQVSNARLMHDISYESDPEVDARLDKIVASMSGICSIEALVNTCGAGARAYRAIIRFLAHRKLFLKSAGRIRYSSMVGATG